MIDIESPKRQKNAFAIGVLLLLSGIVFAMFYDDSVLIDGHRYEHGKNRDGEVKYWHSPNCECKN